MGFGLCRDDRGIDWTKRRIPADDEWVLKSNIKGIEVLEISSVFNVIYFQQNNY